MSGRFPVLATLGVATFVLAACAPAVDTDTPATRNLGPTQSPSKPPTCVIAPATLVSANLGVTVGEPAQTDSSAATVCDYTVTAGGSGTATVRFQIRDTPDAFAVGRKGFVDSGQPVKDITGFFDQAYSSSLGAGKVSINTLVARRGTLEILVTSRATIDQEKALVTAIFGAL